VEFVFSAIKAKSDFQNLKFISGGLHPQRREENERQIQSLQRDSDLFDDIQDMAERLNCAHMVRSLLVFFFFYPNEG